MTDKRVPSRAASVFFVIASISFLVLAAYSLWLDRSATAAIAGALSFAFLLLLQLPYLESMEVLTLKVRLRERLNDAERLTEQLRASASVSARLMYVQLAFMNRIGSIPWARKRLLLTEIDQNLSHLNVPSTQIDEYKRPLLNIVSFDLYLVLKTALDDLLRRHFMDVSRRISEHTEGKPIQADDNLYRALIAERQTYEAKKHDFHDLLADPRLSQFRATTGHILDAYPLPDDDRAKLEIIRNETSLLSEECWREGTITVSAEEYLNKYSVGRAKRLEEIERN